MSTKVMRQEKVFEYQNNWSIIAITLTLMVYMFEVIKAISLEGKIEL